MLNSHWPSFFGNIFDYYLRPGGAYFGAKKGLRPLSVVFDSYATGDHRQARITVVNQSPQARQDLRVRVRTYDLRGRLRDNRGVGGIDIGPGAAAAVMTLPPGPSDSRVFFVRCELLDAEGAVINDNVYWQSQVPDDVGPPSNDTAFDSRQISWADMTPLNSMPRPALEVSARPDASDPAHVKVTLRNRGSQIAFFHRVELLNTAGGEEILPITYDDNYVSVFGGETVEISGRVPGGGPVPAWVRVTGYGGTPVVVAVR
jgi:exo-1,4-beta-D-glucosaminidase